MSVIENSNVAALQKIIATAQAALAALGVDGPAPKLTKGKKSVVAKVAKAPREGGAHAAWTAKITAEWKSVKDAFTAERVAAAEAGTLVYTADSMAVKQGKHSVGEAYTVEGAKAGIHLVWGSLQRQVRAAEYDAFIADWKAAHPNGSAAPSSAASVADDESVAESDSSSKKRGPKKLADMTPEELAAHKAKVAARKTAKTAAKDAEAEIVAPAAPVAVADVPVVVAAPVIVPAPVAEEDEEGAELLPFTFERRKCVRYGTMSGNTIEWATGDIWESKKGAKGTYLGCLSDDETTLDTEADEPEFD